MEGTSNSLVNSVPSFISGLRILLVDHDTTSLMYTASMLEQYSYKGKMEMTTTELASIALSMIEKQKDRFQLVMANVNMPDMDSFTFLRRISDMPVILMSSKKDVDMAKKALSEGACFFLEKPISIEDLRYVWQHAYRKGILAVKETGKVGCEGNTANCEKESLGRKIQEVDRVSGTDTGNGLHGINQAHMIADPKGKNKQIDGKYGLIEGKGREMSQNIGTRGITIAESKEQGKRKRSNEDKNEKQKEKIIETNSQQINSKCKNPMEKEGGEKNDNANSIAEENLLPHLLWDSDLQLKFTSAINALGEKSQVQRSSDTAEAFEANPSSFQSIVPKSTSSFSSRNEFPQSHGRSRSVVDRLQGAGSSGFGIGANKSQFNSPKHSSILERLQGAGTSNTTQFNPPKRYSALDGLRRVGTSSDFGIGAANRTQFNSSISLASPGQYVKKSFQGNLTTPNHKPGFAGLSRNLMGNPHSYYGKNYNQAQMPNYRELHGLNQRREKLYKWYQYE
ncbi:hypothetical protein L1049_007260 [Liquidambar formosana]|uniref:Response regulatory domain-containing protein n=1 Tax=Liquidambar formosana TaxID=63359 RepID=A0AAP0RIG4_LIQFO